jgi:hypothetical protein
MEEDTMLNRDTQVGDTVEIVGHRLGDHARFGEVLEVLGTGDDVRFRVHWDDGRETILYPGADVFVRHAGAAH